MRRVPAVLAALSLGLTGCSFSSVDPNADVHISGRALDAAGKPLTDTQVLLFKQADIGEVLFGTVLTVGSLGSVCLLPDAPAICDRATRARTDAEGRYDFDLTGEDTQGTLGTASTLNVVFTDKGVSTTVSFTAEDEEISLPDARLWRSGARVSSGGGSFRLSWSALPSAAGGKASYAAQAYEAGAASALWSQPAKGRKAAIDQRILEGGAGTVAVSARTELDGASGAGDVRASYLSPRLKVRSGAGRPLSRGRRCAPVTGTAPAQNGAFTRCAATDGNLTKPASLTGSSIVTGAVVDLGSVRTVGLVVARGFAGQVIVEVSTDGRSYATVATSSGTVALDVPAGTRARYVRLRSPAGLDESLSSEISVW